MVSSRIVMMRGSTGQSEDWGEFEFLELPSPADRLMVVRDDAENFATVLAVHHRPSPAASDEDPSVEVVAKWTGSRPKLR